MKIVFMGTPDFSVPILEELIKSEYEVVGVVTQPDKPVGRKKELRPTPVKKCALENNIKVLQPIKVREEYEVITELEPDLIVTAAYGQILPQVLLDNPKYGCINVHASLLPKLRGGAPIHKSITEGHKETGVTIMYMAAKMDAGDIISREIVEIEDTDTVGTLHDKLSLVGKKLLLETIPKIITGDITPIKQNEDEVTYAWNIKREEEKIDWTKTSLEIYNHIRGFNPWPVCYSLLEGKRMKIWLSRLSDKDYKGEPGGIVDLLNDGIVVKTGDGSIVITEIQPEGKKKMPVGNYLNGAGRNYIKVGMNFK